MYYMSMITKMTLYKYLKIITLFDLGSMKNESCDPIQLEDARVKEDLLPKHYDNYNYNNSLRWGFIVYANPKAQAI